MNTESEKLNKQLADLRGRLLGLQAVLGVALISLAAGNRKTCSGLLGNIRRASGQTGHNIEVGAALVDQAPLVERAARDVLDSFEDMLVQIHDSIPSEDK